MHVRNGVRSLRAAVLVIGIAGVEARAVVAQDPDAKPQAAGGRADDVLPFVVDRDAGENADVEGADEKGPGVEAMRQWFDDLDDPDATVRERARVSLMGMRRRDLPAFQKLVRENLPLMPAQAAVLRQLVIHVYLAGEPYETAGAQGFLGVRMQDTSVRVPAGEPGNAIPGNVIPGNVAPGNPIPRAPRVTPPPPSSVGVVIVERMPGFVGARMLLDGDVILGVSERPDVRMLGVYEFQMVVKSITPGTTVHFQVLRQGQVQRVPVTLDPRPFDAEAFILQNLIYSRQRKAEDYWDKAFGPLVKETVG